MSQELDDLLENLWDWLRENPAIAFGIMVALIGGGLAICLVVLLA